MRVTYLLEGTELFGGTKVALRQAGLLARRGHRVAVLAKGPRPEWLSLAADFHQVESFDGLALDPDEVCVATYWTTIAPAAASGGVALHYCQGFEATYTHNTADHPAIEEAYRTPIPAMTVAPHLAELLTTRFGRPARTVTQPLEPFFRPRLWRRRPGRPPRLLVVGSFEIDWKGVETALRAVAELRDRGVETRLVRLCPWPPTREELDLLPPDELHVRLESPRVAALLRGCDLLLAPSWEQEGFGLPVLEAMASGVPAVASDIPSFRWFAGEAASFAPLRRPEAFADRAAGLLQDPAAWRRRRRLGLAGARRFTETRAAAEAEEALACALDRATG